MPKILLLLSIISSSIGLNGFSEKIDNHTIQRLSNSNITVSASNSTLNLPDIVPFPKVTSSEKGYANARHFILADLDTGKVLAKNAEKDEVPIASTTKIMTAVIVLENYKLDDVVTVSEEAATQIGADAYLRTGEKITVENLLNCMLIKSGNDSAYALAEHMSGDVGGVQKFVEAMNKRAKELGMMNTNYNDPAGLDVTGHSSAYDLFLVTKHALTFDKFREIVKKDKWAAKNTDSTIWHELTQSNRLVAEYDYPGAIGVKTGYMPEAGHCLVGAAERDGHTLISIVLSTYADTAPASADESKRLLDWGFKNVEWVQ